MVKIEWWHIIGGILVVALATGQLDITELQSVEFGGVDDWKLCPTFDYLCCTEHASKIEASAKYDELHRSDQFFTDIKATAFKCPSTAWECYLTSKDGDVRIYNSCTLKTNIIGADYYASAGSGTQSLLTFSF